MSAAYQLLAIITAIAHFAFVAFLLAGGLLSYRWPQIVWLHFPVAVYGVMIMAVGWRCPLTDLEIWSRKMAGETVEWTEFIRHYLWSHVGWDGSEWFILVGFMALLVAFNYRAYGAILGSV